VFWLIGLDALCGFIFIYKTRRKPVSRGLDAPTMKMYYKMLNNLINICGCTSKYSMFVHSLKKKDIFMMCVKTQKDVSWKAIFERRKFSILHESYYLRTFVCEYRMSGYICKYFLYKINNIEYIFRQCVHIQTYYIHTQRSLQTVYENILWNLFQETYGQSGFRICIFLFVWLVTSYLIIKNLLKLRNQI
jgi:hypothetical protein